MWPDAASENVLTISKLLAEQKYYAKRLTNGNTGFFNFCLQVLELDQNGTAGGSTSTELLRRQLGSTTEKVHNLEGVAERRQQVTSVVLRAFAKKKIFQKSEITMEVGPGLTLNFFVLKIIPKFL